MAPKSCPQASIELVKHSTAEHLLIYPPTTSTAADDISRNEDATYRFIDLLMMCPTATCALHMELGETADSIHVDRT